MIIYRTDGEWMAVVCDDNLFDTTGEWVGWLDGSDVYSLEGDYVGYISQDGRLLRERVLPYRKRRIPPKRRPRFTSPKSVPLPPLFAELSYSTIDVFEEEPDVFSLVSELRPDAGEKLLPRLVEADPKLALQQKLLKVEQELLEEMIYGIIYSYGVTEPPVPVEAMAAGVHHEKAGDIKIASPEERQRISEALIKRLGQSDWAQARGYCSPKGFTPAQIEFAARALLLPRHWLLQTPQELHTPLILARRYIVTEQAATLRIHDLE
jgi:hypothetical protein